MQNSGWDRFKATQFLRWYYLLLGLRRDNGQFIPQLLELHSQGKFPVDRLCKVYKAKDINEAIEDAEKGTTIKPVLVWD